MNIVLGARIRSLRESKGLTQEQIAKKLNCTRQKYARIEKGVIDISFASIASVAKILGVKTEEITSSVNEAVGEQPIFRENGAPIGKDSFEFINEMLDIFYTHRKLYKSIRQVDYDE
jgi:transcriptional regulator with XRE-family HTH domain